MGLQGLHKFANSKGVYKEVTSLCSALKEHKTDIIFIDFCNIFFSLLQRGSDAEIIKDALADKSKDQRDDPKFQKAVDQFINLVLGQAQRLRGKENQVMDICFVIDGYSLPAKADTCKARKSKKRNVHRNTFAWKIRAAILKNLQTRKDVLPYRERVKEYAPSTKKTARNKKKGGNTYFQYSRFEADAEIVYLCQNIPTHQRGAIISEDGDLFAYPGAFDALRILKICWREPAISATIATKSDLFKELGFSITKKSRQLSEIKFAVLASLCGNDFAPKFPTVSFTTILQKIKGIKNPSKDNISADVFMQQVMEKIMQNNKSFVIPKNFDTKRFGIALHQFCTPQVTGVTRENNDKLCCYYSGLPIKREKAIIDLLGNETDLLPWSADDESLIESTPALEKRLKELQEISDAYYTLSSNQQATIRNKLSSTTTQTIVHITFNKSSILSLLASSKPHMFTLLALVICYYPLLFFFFYIYMVTFVFLCISFVLSSSTLASSVSSKFLSK